MKDTTAKPVWPPQSTNAYVRYRPAEPRDVLALAEGIRAIDLQEMKIRGSADLKLRIERAIAVSSECWALTENEELVALFGVERHKCFDCPWFLGTDKADDYMVRFVRDAKAWLNSITRTGIPLVNNVWKENGVSIRWLKRLGFTIHAELPTLHGAPSGLLGFSKGTVNV